MENENAFLKKNNESLKKDLFELNIQTSKAKTEANKQEETVAYLFTRTKVLSTLISSFYTHSYGVQEPEHKKQEYVLSYENMHSKLQRIFKDYEILAKKTKRFDFGTETTDSEGNRLSFNSNHNTRDRRSTSTNIAPKTESVFRSKSPAPGYTGGYHYGENNNLGVSNRIWNESHRLK